MTKKSGLGQALWVSGFDLSGDIGSVDSCAGGPASLGVTGIDKFAEERIGGLRDGHLDFTSFFNPTAAQAHDVLTIATATTGLDFTATYSTGTALGSDAASLIGKEPDYAGTRAQDGSFILKSSFLSNGFGVDWGNLLTAGKRTDSTATAPATGVDFTDVSTAFGWQAFLHVFAVTGTSVTVTIQDSADNSSFTNLTGGAFTAATGVTSQRLQGGRTATVRRYLKVNTTGTFSNAVFAVSFTRNIVSVAF